MIALPRWFADWRAAGPDGSKIVTLNGIRTQFFGAADDPYYRTLGSHSRALRGLAALLARHVPPGATVIDVGANLGLSTILLARAAARVIAFEPSPPNVAFLRRNLAANGIANVEVHAAAVSDRPGTLRFHVAQYGAGSHVVGAGHVAGAIASVPVPAVALDGLELPPIAFIKIDAEGHEPDVLAGARALLARDRPLIQTEVNVWCLSAFAGHSPGAFVRALWHAFDVGAPAPDGGITPLPDGYAFLHDAITRRGGLADITLRPRAGAAMPTLAELTWPAAALAGAPA